MKISRLSVSASRKSASQHLTLSVYIINRILHAYMWIRILSSRVQLDISLVRCTHALMRYRVQHSKTKFVSTCGHVISSIHKIMMYTYLNFAAGMSYLPPSPIVRNNKSYLYVEVIFNMRKHLLTALL